MGKKKDYCDYLKQTLGGLVDRLDISDLRKEFLKNRWLDQLMWLEGKATKERDRHNLLRMITIIGGVLVPALVGFRSADNARLERIVGWTALGLSQTVAISAAVEEFFGHGDKYRNYRNTAEGMKIEGWQFFQLSGPYQRYGDHSEAYTTFADRVEQYIRQDVEGFLARLEEKRDEAEDATKAAQLTAQSALENINVQLEERARQLAEAQQQDLARSASGAIADPEPVSADSDPSADLPPLGAAALPWEEDVDLEALKALLAGQQRSNGNGRRPSGNGSSSGTNGLVSSSGGVQMLPQNVPQLISPEEVSQILDCPLQDCRQYLPGILAALQSYDILDKHVLIGMLATIRVETGGLKPVHELGGKSYWKRYEGRKDLGNINPGDGIRYHGRGYIQVTGRANYRTYGKKLGVDLENSPDLAMDPVIAAKVLACYFKDRGVATAARAGDWRRVRKLVNGGYHGWDVFSKYVERAKARIVV